MITLKDVSKTFTLHNQGSAVIEVISDVSFRVAPGECVALTGASGAGKSTLMRMIYGNYLTQSGSIQIGDLDIVQAEPREIIALRREVLGYAFRASRHWTLSRTPCGPWVCLPKTPKQERKTYWRSSTSRSGSGLCPRQPSLEASSSGSTSRAVLLTHIPRCFWTNPRRAWMRPTAKLCCP